MNLDIPGIEEAQLADPTDRDQFFRGPIIRGFIWDDERVRSWSVEACVWTADMWPWGDKEQGRLITLRWKIQNGDYDHD